MNRQSPKWFAWAQEIFSLSQSGITYSGNQYDIDRYRRLQEITAEMISSQSDMAQEAVLESFSMQAGYITPKVDVRGAVIRENKILLIQERADDKWAMPGGWADLGNSPASVAEREVFEESGFHVKAEKVVAVIDANRIEPMEFYHAYKIIFLRLGSEAPTLLYYVPYGEIGTGTGFTPLPLDNFFKNPKEAPQPALHASP